eukprot:c21175_g1_i1.p1 GENE.c21175_g1_i1~~c21175_g1_i1.p1  ORF type:complete len:381 (+),score=146.60 c21175_g1_i1:11-1153(+)
MVCVEEVSIGDFVEYEGEVYEILELSPLDPAETGTDGKNKFRVVLELQSNKSQKTINFQATHDLDLTDAPGKQTKIGKGRREAVSGESDVNPESLAKWQKKVVEKNEGDRANIRKIVGDNVFFAHLDEAENNELIDVVFDKSFNAGDVLMRQGAQGDLFYIIDKGDAEIFVLDENKNEKLVRSCKDGDSFGELALMYNAPRNATVKAKTDLRCWCMDRESFKYVIMGGSIRKRDRYLGFLDSVKIFSTMDVSEKMKLVDALIPRKVKSGVSVVKQGDAADMFYIVEKGKLTVSQLNPQGVDEVVNEKNPGDYFGEIALMSDMPRSATVTTVEDSVLLTLDRNTFISLLGPMADLLRRNVALYKTYIDYTRVVSVEETNAQ